MSRIDSKRPAKLYRYAERAALERALQLGEFRLCSVDDIRAAAQIMPFAKGKQSAAGANYLTLSFARAWDERLFDQAPTADCCLVINKVEEFGERIHRAAQLALPNWAGIDAAISYGSSSPLGAVFSKAARHASQQEWLFAWRPMQAGASMNPVIIRIGNIEGLAELHEKSHAGPAG
ncbi:hypothetical protein BH11PSE11_BH11PSE11_18820 [soil metagenome]